MRSLFLGSIVAATVVCGVTVAQNPQRDNPAIQPAAPRTGQPSTQTGLPGQANLANQQIAACLYAGVSNEIEIAKLGETKAQSPEVRQFAEQMVKDHTPCRDELKQIAGNLINDSRQRTDAGTRTGSTGGLDWVNVKKELAEQCLESTKKELSAKASNEFDHCFMIQQGIAHMHMVDELTVLRNHASGELRTKLDKELQTAQQHLQLAKDLAKKLDGQSERTARRPDGNK